MSKCISREGEYSEHQIPATDHPYLEPKFWPWVCGRCWALDEEALIDAATTSTAHDAEVRADERRVGWVSPETLADRVAQARAEGAAEGEVRGLRSAADNMPLRRPFQSWSLAAEWLRGRAAGIENRIEVRSRRTGSTSAEHTDTTHPKETP